MSHQPPNILFIVTDQQRYDSLGCNGNPFAKTPRLDELAGQSVVFDRCMSPHAVCMPSRASIVTGLYPGGHGVWCNGAALARAQYTPSLAGEMLDQAHPGRGTAPSHHETFADRLAAAGYDTAAVGKLHLTPTQSHPDLGFHESTELWSRQPEQMADWHGPYFGFEHVELTLGHGERCGGHFGHWLSREHPEAVKARTQAAAQAHRPTERRDLYRGGLTIETHPTTWIAHQACQWISKQSNNRKPWMLWTGIPDPHHPFTPPAEAASQFEDSEVLRTCATTPDHKPSAYGQIAGGPGSMRIKPETARWVRQYTMAMEHLIDRAVGQMIDTLHRTNQWENTVVIFTSDHGDFLGDFGLLYKFPLADRTLNHVPMIARFPGRSARRVATAVSLVDISPTLLALAGIDGVYTHGRSLLDSAENATPRHHPVLTQNYGHGHDHRQINFTLWHDRFRYTWYPQTNEAELYDHDHDPCEQNNLHGSPDYRSLGRDLQAQLLEAHARCDQPSSGRQAIW